MQLTDELIKDLEFAIALAGSKYPDRAEAISKRLAECRALSAQEQAQPKAQDEREACLQIKPWQARLDWASKEPVTQLLVEAMKAEIAELRAVLSGAAQDNDADLLDIARTICAVAAHVREHGSHEYDPSPLSEFSPLLIAAREACLKRGFTADGLAIAAAMQTKEAK